MPDLLRVGFALLPLSCYLTVLGLLRFRKHPTILSRGFDLLLLGLGCTGLIAVGPIELFFPRAAYAIAGNYVWFILLGLYGLVLVLIAFNTSLGLVAYGLNSDGLKSVISDVLVQQNIAHSWQEDSLLIPALGVQGIVSDSGMGDTACLTAVGKRQDVVRWVQLEQEIAKAAASRSVQPSRSGPKLLLFGATVAMIALLGFIFRAEQLRDSVSWIFE